jgi:uncharacterized protein
MSTTLTKREIGEALIAALQEKDLEALMAQMHPELEVFEPESLPYGGTWKGPEGFGELLEKLLALGDLSIQDATIHEIDDGVLMEIDFSFTSHKDGEVFRTSAIEIDRLKDGLVREIDIYYKDVAAANEFFARQ